jgi:hypothetical protein
MFLSEQNTAKALVGVAVWLLVLPFSLSDSPEGELIQRILLLGVLVIVPLGLALIDTISDRSSAFLNIAAASQPFAALAVIISSFLDPGISAAGLALPWLITTSLIGLDGLIRLGRLRNAAGSAFTTLPVLAAMIYLPVGAVWLIMSRLGIQPLGFGDTIVLLTAVHFHFAGFAAPLLTGLTGHHLPASSKTKPIYLLAVVGVIAGTPLVAAGITFSPLLALVGAIVISIGLVCLVLINITWILPFISTLLPKTLMVISSVSVIPAMALAGVYAYSIVFHKLIVDIPQMAMTHGVINAFGFALCGLVAWVLLLRRERVY